MIKLNLEKSTAALKLSLEKKGIVDPPTIDVAIAMDDGEIVPCLDKR